MKKALIVSTLLAFVLGGLAAQTVDYAAIVKKADDLSNFKNSDFFVTITMVTEKVNGEKEAREAKLFRRDTTDDFLLLINKPEVERGQGYLKNGDNMWFYDPNTRQFSHTSIKERVSSSNANNSDFAASSMSEDYTVTSGTEGKLGKFDVYIVELEAKKKTATYPYLKVYITKDQNLVLQHEEYSLSKKLMRTNLYKDYVSIDGKMIPRKSLFIDNLSKDPKTGKMEQTQLTMSDISTKTIKDEVFTQAYLERVSN